LTMGEASSSTSLLPSKRGIIQLCIFGISAALSASIWHGFKAA
jgi:hypothetical protein